MNKTFIIMWQFIFAITAELVQNTYEEKGLVFIGSLKSFQNSTQSDQRFDENDYYVSVNPTVWSSAAEDCSNILGPNGGLIGIESLEEWEFLIALLENYGFGTTYWSSGKFDIFRNEWIWSINNQPIPPNSPWGAGHPSASPNLSHRIQIYHTSRYDAAWRSVADTQLHRYICELRKVDHVQNVQG